MLLQLRSRILESTRNSRDSLKEIFDRECLASPVGHLLAFSSLERTMRNVRLRNVPRLPQTVEDFYNSVTHDAVGNMNGENMFKARVVIAGVGEAVILSSRVLLTTMRTSKEIIADATFKCVPRMFYQLLTVGCFKDGFVRLMCRFSKLFKY